MFTVNTSSAHTYEKDGVESVSRSGPLEFRWNFTAPLEEKIVIIYMTPIDRKLMVFRERTVVTV